MAHSYIVKEDWEGYRSRQFADWFSQLEGMRSPVLVGTAQHGINNLAVFNSMTHVGARPPHVGLVFRPLTVERDTYDNIKATRFYTINHLPADFLVQAHQTSAKYASSQDEFAEVGLTPQPSSLGAPYVAEASVSFLLEMVEEHHIAANDTVFLVGAVREIRLPEGISIDTEPNWSKLNGLVVSGLYSYYRVDAIRKLGYVKP